VTTLIPPETLPSLPDDPFGTQVLTDPYEFHHRLREAGPVVLLPRYGLYGMGRFDEVKAVLQDWETFVSSRGAGLPDFAKEGPWRPPSLLLEADPPDHRVVRTAIKSVSSRRTTRTLRERLSAPAEEIADRLVERGTFDAVTDLAVVYPPRVFPDAVGLPEEGREHLLPYGALAFNAFGPDNELRRTALVNAAPVQEWILASCQREALAPGGFGARIWEAADRGDITHEQAPMLVRSLLGAGVGTTVYGIANTMYALATNQGEWEKLHGEPKLAKFAFDEALRWESLVQTFFRTTSCDVEVAGSVIPAGSKVLLFLGPANRDPRQWDERADQFDIRRRAAGQVAFGMGVHQCVGQPMARLESELVLFALAHRVPRIELAGPPKPKLKQHAEGLG